MTYRTATTSKLRANSGTEQPTGKNSLGEEFGLFWRRTRRCSQAPGLFLRGVKMKKCSKCHEIKDDSAFSLRTSRKGLRSSCKMCRNKYAREHTTPYKPKHHQQTCVVCGNTFNTKFRTKTCPDCRLWYKRLNVVWNNVRRRCGEFKSSNYPSYKGRKNLFSGWEEFYSWAIGKYKIGYDIHRTQEDYSPESCIFLPAKEHEELHNKGINKEPRFLLTLMKVR